MNKKRAVAILCIVISIFISAISFWITYYQGLSRNTTMVTIYLSAVLLGVFGTILLFTNLLDKIVLPMVDELIEDTRDDHEDLKKGYITFVHISGLLLITLTIGFAVLVSMFSKFSARWGSIPVLIPTLIVLGFTTWALTGSRWFNSKADRTPPIIFIILFIGMILSLALGITKTENINRGLRTPIGEYDYDYRAEQAMYLATDNGPTIVDFSFGMISDCDGDACLWLVVIVLVLVATVILVAGSASIIHFWFFSGSILLCGMWIIFLRELRVRPEI
jgi:hypothetical protein